MPFTTKILRRNPHGVREKKVWKWINKNLMCAKLNGTVVALILLFFLKAVWNMGWTNPLSHFHRSHVNPLLVYYQIKIKSESSYFKFEIPFPLISAYNDKLTFETPEECEIFITLKTDDNNLKHIDHRFLLDKEKNLFLTVYCGYIHHEIIKKDFCSIC